MNQPGNSTSWLERYNASHQHPLNRALHAVGIPLIVVSIPVGIVSLGVPGLRIPAVAMFAGGWLLQFAGHWVEGKPPAFFSDWRFLFAGLAWWLRKLRRRQ